LPDLSGLPNLINIVACNVLAGGCGDAGLECRPFTRLCMPKETDLTPCLFDEDAGTELCGAGLECAEGYCIPDTAPWNGPRRCVFDSDCEVLDDNGEVVAGSNRCNHTLGGYCLSECLEGELCADGSTCSCDCPRKVTPVTQYRAALQVHQSVVAFSIGAATEYAPRAAEFSISLDSRAFGTAETYPLGDLLVIASPGLVVAAESADPLTCLVNVTDGAELATAAYVKECVVPVTLDKQDAARSAMTRSVWLRPRLDSPFEASEVRLVAPWAAPQSASVGVRVVGARVDPEDESIPDPGDSPIAGAFRGHAILSAAPFIESYGQEFKNRVGQQIPVSVRMGEPADPDCPVAAGYCVWTQPFEVESESAVLGQPTPLRLEFIWFTFDNGSVIRRIAPQYGNVWTEAALAYAYREEVASPDPGDGELQRFGDHEVALPITEFGEAAWWTTADGEHVEATTQLFVAPYPIVQPGGVLAHAFPVRLDLFIDYEGALDALPAASIIEQYDVDSMLARPFQTEVQLYELVQAYDANQGHPVAECFSERGRKNLRERYTDVAFECAQRMLCYLPGESDQPPPLRHFGSSILPRSGELACGTQDSEPGRWEALPLFAGFGEAGEDTSVGELLVACYEELTRPFLEDLRAVTAIGDGVEQLERLLAHDAQCVDLARLYGAIASITAEYGHSQDVAHNSMQYYNANRTGYDDSSAKRLLHRLLSQWVKLHSFVARETVSEASLLAVFGADPYAGDLLEAAEGVPSLEQALELMERGWSLLLHPALARPMAPNRTFALSLAPDDVRVVDEREAYLYPEYLRAPDYRTGLAVSVPERPQYDQSVGLPVFIIEGLTAHFELLEAYMREVAESEYASCHNGGLTSKQEAALSHFGTASRYALVLEQLARDFESVATLAPADGQGSEVANPFSDSGKPYTDDSGRPILVLPRNATWGPSTVRSLAPDGVPPWKGRWMAALEEFFKARDRTTAVAQGIAECNNVLKISDRDTPLFFGDPAGASNRYFAASDYLLNTWALPAVQRAQGKLSAARDAWMAETRTRVQEIANEFEYARRIEQLKESYGRPVVEACGLSVSAQDAFDYFAIPPSLFLAEPTYGFALDREVEKAFNDFENWYDQYDENQATTSTEDKEEDLRYAGGLLPGNCHIVRSKSCSQTLNRIWQETASEGEEFYNGSCHDHLEYARLNRAQIQEELCKRAYSMSHPERVELLNRGGVTDVLSAVFNEMPITYKSAFSEGDRKQFWEMSDSQINELAKRNNEILDGLKLVSCNRKVVVDLEDDGAYDYEFDVTDMFNKNTTILNPKYLSLSGFREGVRAQFQGNVPDPVFPDLYLPVGDSSGRSNNLSPNSSNRRQVEDVSKPGTPPDTSDNFDREGGSKWAANGPLLRFHGVTWAFTESYCGNYGETQEGGERAIDLFGGLATCKHSWYDHFDRFRHSSHTLPPGVDEPEYRVELAVEHFFPRVDRYCAQYAERRYVTNTMSLDGPSYEMLNPGELASCLGGRLGGSDIDILMARQRVRMAETSLRTLNANIFIRTNNCIYKRDVGAERQALVRMRNEAQRKAQADIMKIQGSQALIGHVFAAANGMLSGGGNPFQVVAGGLLGLGSSVLQSETNAKIEEVEAAHRELDHEYTEMIGKLSEDEQLADCWMSVALLKEEIDDKIETIRHELLGVANALQQRDQLVQQVANTLRDGTTTIARETARKVPSLEHHYWVSEHIDQFHREMRWAKRLVYLAARAVEYEFQQSLNVRSMVLEAKHPNELEAALGELQREQASRTINRNRPEDDILVLSMRDDLLDVAEELGPVGSVTGTRRRIERLREQILSGQNAVYDRSGSYLGQGLRLYLGPRGELNYRCGERLWRVSASVQGDQLGAGGPDVPLFLLKQNTFKSQWCEGRGEVDSDYEESDEFQYGHLQPSARLFSPDGSTSDGEGIDAYSWGFVKAQINTPKTEFHRAAYQEGGSEEFAGRGLYGEYVLLFPWHGLIDDGFVLDNIEDILLRFDYLSVSDGPGEVTFP
jgi:hypothetical protein